LAEQTPKQTLEQLRMIAELELTPAQRIIHKPLMSGKGQALKLQLTLRPKLVDGADYFDRESLKQGGLFLEIAPQGPTQNGNATFLWRDDAQLVRAKLGVPDIAGLLLAIRSYRLQALEVPAALQDRKNPQGHVVSLFHKNPNGSTIITYEFRELDSILGISHSDGRRRSISLRATDEFVFQRYLELSLDAYLKVGKR
jgi:hypothetical protein